MNKDTICKVCSQPFKVHKIPDVTSCLAKVGYDIAYFYTYYSEYDDDGIDDITTPVHLHEDEIGEVLAVPNPITLNCNMCGKNISEHTPSQAKSCLADVELKIAAHTLVWRKNH